MADPRTRIKKLFADSVALKQRCGDMLSAEIAAAAELLLKTLQNRRKILTCGNGGSAADAQHFSSEMLNRFERERDGLAALSLCTDTSTLTSIANDYSFSDVFAKQIRALGCPGDALLAYTTSGHSANIVAAINAAQEKNMRCVLISGRDGGAAAQRINDAGIEIRVPSSNTARIQEIHLLITHCVCDLIDNMLLEGT